MLSGNIAALLLTFVIFLCSDHLLVLSISHGIQILLRHELIVHSALQVLL